MARQGRKDDPAREQHTGEPGCARGAAGTTYRSAHAQRSLLRGAALSHVAWCAVHRATIVVNVTRDFATALAAEMSDPV
jgi:hypothetical protein